MKVPCIAGVGPSRIRRLRWVERLPDVVERVIVDMRQHGADDVEVEYLSQPARHHICAAVTRSRARHSLASLEEGSSLGDPLRVTTDHLTDTPAAHFRHQKATEGTTEKGALAVAVCAYSSVMEM